MSQTINTDEYIKEQTKILSQLENLESTEFMTKKEYILKLKEVTRPLVLAYYYPDTKLNDLCSFIQQTLEKYNISYPRTKLPELFNDDEKRTYKSVKTNVTTGDKSVPPLKQKPRKKES